MPRINSTFLLFFVSSLTCSISVARGELPVASYIFPAGGQRGTTVTARVGGCNLHDSPKLFWSGAGVVVPSTLKSMETLWFEGPVIPQPASQQKEDYPRDFGASLTIADDAASGLHTWRLSTSQGITAPWGFVVGTFPEIIEDELEGVTPAVRVTLPVTINGRVFPREDIDSWSFEAKAGESITCHVATNEFGSPLAARLEVRGPQGQVIAERIPEGTRTPLLFFIAPRDGEYQIRVHDSAFGGLQDHVYRLTLTKGPVLKGLFPLGGRRGTKTTFESVIHNSEKRSVEIDLPQQGDSFAYRLHTERDAYGEVVLDLGDINEHVERNQEESNNKAFEFPAALNGRISSPGEVDEWAFTGTKGNEFDFEVRAARLGSPLDAVLEVVDSKGNRLAEVDDSQGLETDARLRWIAPADGEYRLRIRDRILSRGNSDFAYRIIATSAAHADFDLTTSTDTIVLERGKSVSFKVMLERGPGFKEPVTLEVEGLPSSVSVEKAPLIAAGQKDIQIQLKAEALAPITQSTLKIVGKAKSGETELIRIAMARPAPVPGNSNSPTITDNSLRLAVAVPTPFKFVGAFETKFISRGGVFLRRYRIERNGFEGPLEVRLADRQGRHLQGVTASPVIVPSGVDDFEFAVTLPPWMEIGRTCRSTLALSGVTVDPDGTQHTISYSSNDQNNQMIALVDPGRLAIKLARSTIVAVPGQLIEVPFTLQRDRGLSDIVVMDAVIAKGCRGIKVAPVEVAAGTNNGVLKIQLENSIDGIEIRPITIRARTRDERGFNMTAEATLELLHSNN